jgi:hypothetical protein
LEATRNIPQVVREYAAVVVVLEYLPSYAVIYY